MTTQAPGHPPTAAASEWIGFAFIALSATGFATLAIFGKLAYAAGMGLPTLLALRFAGAALLMWVYVLATRGQVVLPRRRVVALLALGAIGYAVQASLYLGALVFISAALTGMLLYTYPAFVVLLAWLVDGDRPDRLRWIALGLALIGTTLTAGRPESVGHPIGLALGVGAGLWYSGYITISDRLIRDVPSLTATTYVVTGAAGSFVFGGALFRQLGFDFGPDGWAAAGGMVLLATVVPIAAFFAGLARVGPARAAILSTLEPVITVILAVLLLGERLTSNQITGGALILTAVLLLQTRGQPALSPATDD